MAQTLKTIAHTYNFDTRDPDQKAAYATLKEKLATWPHCMESHTGNRSDAHYKPWLDELTIDLETKYLFDNQWNTAPITGNSEKGMRIFDWAQDTSWTCGNSYIKRGYYLEQTAEMREIRRNTNACGYCGKQEPAAKGDVFCRHCLDSEYLEKNNLHLLRMRAIDETGNRPPLTHAECAHLVPLYRAAQLHGSTERGKQRIAKKRQDVQETAARQIANAQAERDGFLWLMDHGINTDNVIYYSHSGQFCFGWRKPCSPDFVSALLDIISEFKWPYEIKRESALALTAI